MSAICRMARARGGNPLSSAVLSSMMKSLLHRGPDDEGFYLRNDVALAVRRLSVIDPEGGHQPLSNEGHSIWIVYNGEIYNFPSIRRELLSRLDQISGELFLDLKTYLADDLLVKIDRMSMAASLETRI